MNKYSYVYILVDKSTKKFKIGMTVDILQRFKTLNLVYGDFSTKDSYIIKCKDDFGKKLEKILHFTFSDFNLNINSKKEGHTEWFDISCLSSVIKFVNEIEKINKNIVAIKKDIQLIEKINKSKKKKKEYIAKQLKRENILNTIAFLKTIKKMIISKKLYKKDSFTLIYKNIPLNEAKKISYKLFLVLSYKTENCSGECQIIDYIKYSKFTKNLEISFNFDFLCNHKDKEQVKKSYFLIKSFFKKYFNIDINKQKYNYPKI